MEAAAEPSEYHGPAVARRIALAGEDRRENLCRPVHLTLVQQALAAFALGDIPGFRGWRAGFGPRAGEAEHLLGAHDPHMRVERHADAGAPTVVHPHAVLQVA